MAGLENLLGRARNTPEHRRAKLLATNDYKLLADLVQVRRDSGLTQHDVAERLGISQQAVSKLENYSSDPRLSTLRRYAHAVGALVAHVVEADDGQLSEGRAWVSFTYSIADVPPARTYVAPALRRGDFAIAA